MKEEVLKGKAGAKELNECSFCAYSFPAIDSQGVLKHPCRLQASRCVPSWEIASLRWDC